MVRNMKHEEVPLRGEDERLSQRPPAASSQSIPDSLETNNMDLDEDHDASNDLVNAASINNLGRGVKELVKAVQALRHLGIEDLDLPLPKIVVVGDQSTGKSSLIEGMSEIKVPRQVGTCTRCPLEINLTASMSQRWSCEVFIHKKYIYEPRSAGTRNLKNPAKAESATRTRPLGPWTVQDSENFHFATITSATEVEHVIYLAQLAILNPGSPIEKYAYVPGKPRPPEKYQTKFSPNVIRLDISGGDLPNLSFYDLPGVINVPEVPEEAYLVDLVKNLVKEYITQEGCINLLAISMTDDPANSSASQLVRDVKAEGRTLGCLTKPDRLQNEESLEQWIQILRGQRFRLGYGYHVVKNNPSSLVDHAQARQEESEFFQDQAPWSTVLRTYNPCFGTINLQTSLSRLLTAQIQKALPSIYENINQKADDIETALRELPEPISGNLPAIVMGELMNFEAELKKRIDGGLGSCLFQKDFNTLAEHFRDSLSSLRPRAILSISQNQLSVRSKQGIRGSPAGSAFSTPTPRAREANATPIMIDSDQEDDRENDEGITGPGSVGQGRKRPAPSNEEGHPYKNPRLGNQTLQQAESIQKTTFSLVEVRTIIQNTYIGLPGQVHPKATEELITISTEKWRDPVDDFIGQTKELCDNLVIGVVRATFSHRQNTNFYGEVLQECERFLEAAYKEQRRMSDRLLSWEQTKPKTLNEDAMSRAKQENKALLHQNRRMWRASAYLDEQDQKNPNRTSEVNRKDRLTKVPDDKLAPEIFGPELETLAEVRAYYECAYIRFVDMMVLSIQCDLFGKIRDGIFQSLKDRIDLMDEQANSRLAVLLAINPVDEERRTQLKKERQTLQSALEELESVARNQKKT